MSDVANVLNWIFTPQPPTLEADCLGCRKTKRIYIKINQWDFCWECVNHSAEFLPFVIRHHVILCMNDLIERLDQDEPYEIQDNLSELSDLLCLADYLERLSADEWYGLTGRVYPGTMRDGATERQINYIRGLATKNIETKERLWVLMKQNQGDSWDWDTMTKGQAGFIIRVLRGELLPDEWKSTIAAGVS